MKRLSIILFLIFSTGGASFAQFPQTLLKQVRQLKLLESNRNDVKRILAGYEATDDDGHYQEFSNEHMNIEVSYSSGTCTDDRDSEDATEIWNVPEWRVTRIEITPNEAIELGAIALDLSKFKRQPRFPDNTDLLVFYDKLLGLAVKTSEDGIEKIIFFPSRSKANSLCRVATAAKGFYIRKGWFSAEQPYDYTVCVMQFANVVALDLDSFEIEATSNTTISVVTTAVDPENDVLTYNYTVSAGKILGAGAKVVWDLTGVAAGTYSITAGVDDGCGICGTTITKSIVIK